uniref:UPF0160 protein MYG1, mitochondrial n=1 Tax=Meloidogyne hapla TaxID=6305 RepID=A0A1I8BNE7_MELHA
MSFNPFVCCFCGIKKIPRLLSNRYLSLFNSLRRMHNNWIGTHDGKFHCDEVFACYMLKKLPKFADYTIVRTRDQAILDKCDVVVDVGGVYDHRTKRYDHHQREFKETMRTLTGLDFDTKLSSAGLIYAHYGKQLIAQIIGIESEDNPDLLRAYERLYKSFIESVDAIDNGINQFEGTPKYQLASTLTSRVQYCNPAWNDPSLDPDKAFSRAKEIVGEEFEEQLLSRIWQNSCFSFWRSFLGKNTFLNWKRKWALKEKIFVWLFILMMLRRWRLQAIPISETSGFDNRVKIPWMGARDKDLEEQSGIPGAIFVHTNGFIGGAKTKEGALNMAIKTIEQG